ncbi:MAG TPA: DNA polymerase IV [Rhodanobacteraceae bacterium]
MPSLRKIIHIDMDAFYASVEQRDDPSLRGKPVVVAWRGQRSVVCAASYEARKFGVHSAMPAVRAERLCPQAIFVPPDFARYKAASHAIHTVFHQYTPLIEPLSLDEAYLDVTEASRGRSATAIAQAIRAKIFTLTHLTASAGVAPNKFLAKIASDWHKPNGIMVVRPRDVEAFLTPLDVARIPGVGKVMQARLAALGIGTVGQLRARPREELEQRFGRWGVRLHYLSHGIDERPVQSDRPTLQVSAEDTFASDLPLDALEPHIRQLAATTWARHQRQHERVARTVTLKLKTTDFHILTRSLTPPRRPTSEAELADLACALRQHVALPASTLYRLVGVGLSGFVDIASEAAQGDLFDADSAP